MWPLPNVGPRLPLVNGLVGASVSKVHSDFPVAASTANSLDPELKYITPSATSGVTSLMLSPPVSNDHFNVSLLTFEALISSSGEYRRLARSTLWESQSVLRDRSTFGSATPAGDAPSCAAAGARCHATPTRAANPKAAPDRIPRIMLMIILWDRCRRMPRNVAECRRHADSATQLLEHPTPLRAT